MQDAWDSYIQNGNAIDPAFQFYPAGDGSQPSPESQQQQQQQQQDQQGPQIDGAGFGNSVFMGANTPR